MLFIGGSEGGLTDPRVVARIAGLGFAVLDIACFGEKNEPRLPATLADVPVEYFATAAQRLAAQPEVDPAHVAVWGGSRGSEGAALLAGHYPQLVHGAVLEAPSSVVNQSFPRSDRPAWTFHGRPVPAAPQIEYGEPDPSDAQDALLPIPEITGPVVTICGALDELWRSCAHSAAIDARIQPPSRLTALRYPYAGRSPVSFGIAAADDALPRIAAVLHDD